VFCCRLATLAIVHVGGNKTAGCGKHGAGAEGEAEGENLGDIFLEGLGCGWCCGSDQQNGGGTDRACEAAVADFVEQPANKARGPL